jgi:guanylate kinase
MTLVLRPVQSHIISISGRAGTGKSAMAKGLLKKFGRYAKMVPSYMTREKRPNEKEGFDGVFITHAEFEALIEKGAFTSPNGTALWVEQGGNYYGRRADDFMHSGVSIIDVSYSGLELMRKAFPDQVYAVLIRSNMSDERNREILEARGVHEPEEIERRVRIGRQMMQPEVYEPLNFNFITANRRGELDKNVAMVAAEFRKWRDAAAVKDNPPLLKMGTPLLHKPSGGKYIVKETEVDDDGTWFVLEDDSGSRQFVSEEELLQMYTQYPTSPEWRANPPEDISVEPMSTTPIHYAVMMDEYHELREKSNRTRGEDKRLQYLKSFLDALGVHTDFRTNPPGVPKPGKELSKERKREIRKKWLELVNMTQSELQAFYDSEWGNDKAGLSREEAREQGISSGRDSALAILKMKETPVREWHKKRSKDRGRGIMLDFWQWAQKQINFNTRHRAMQGAYLDDKGRPKRKLLGLWIWGHDPWRYAMKVEPERMPTAPDVVWVGRKEKEHFGVGPVGGVHANPPAEDSATMLTGFQTDGKGSSYNLLRSNGQTIPVDPATKPNGEHPVFGKRYAKKFSRQDHPAFSPLPFEARRWKKSTFKTGAETDIDSWKGKIDDSMGATVTLKIDGEGTVAHFDGNETVLWNWYDRWRTGFHITDVLTKRLKSREQIKSAKIMGELFAVDADGNMLPMTGGGTDANGRSETSSSIIKSPQTMERQQRIRWLAFDILEVDGQDYSDRSFDERLSKLVSMLGRSMVVPHIKARGPSSQVPASKVLETAWREWGHDPEFEGAVLHLFRRQRDEPIGVYKVKGAATADMVVLGGYWGSSAQKDGNKGTFADMVGGLAVGWMMPNGEFVYSGNVGTGFNFSQREDLVKVIRKHGVKADTPTRWGSHLLGAPRGRKQEDDGNGKMVALDPHSSGLIVEVEYRGLNWSERPVYRFQDSVMYQVGTTKAPTLFQPSFKRFREDKSVSPDDLRMSQVAGEGEGKWTTRPEAHGAARKKKQKGSNRICPHPEKVKFSTMAEADAAIPIHKRGWVRSYRCPVDGPAHYHHTKNLHRNAPSKNRTRSIRDSEVQSFRIPRIRVYPGEMTPGLLRKHRDHIFLFGDNERREGKGGQAKIRDEPNAFGIRTKRAPKTNQGAYWSDENYQQNIEMMADDFRRVFREIRPGMTLVIPGSGLGTGRALLPERAPKTFEWLLFVVGSLMMMADKNPAKGGL